jgi:hypothetical protein
MPSPYAGLCEKSCALRPRPWDVAQLDVREVFGVGTLRCHAAPPLASQQPGWTDFLLGVASGPGRSTNYLGPCVLRCLKK